MKKAIIRILKAVGIYNFFLDRKKAIDKRTIEKMEKENSRRRMIFYSEFLRPGDLVFDVGANIGNRSDNFLKIGTRVVAVEPQPDCIRILKEKFNEGIIVEPFGLGSKEDEMEMFIADETTLSTFSSDFINKTKDVKFKRNVWEKRLKVRITTLDRLIQKHGTPDFCKIDVEGFEIEVLKGLSFPIRKLSFEYSVPDMSENVYQNIAILHHLSGNYVFNYCIGESMRLALPEWKNADDFIQVTKEKPFLATHSGDIYAFIRDVE